MAVDVRAITEAVAGLDFKGNEEGLVPAFGLYLTSHCADYYNRVSYGLLGAFRRELPELEEDAIALLTEAGHVCAFNTFGGIMMSVEWDAVVRPMLSCREDWVHGMIGAEKVTLACGAERTHEPESCTLPHDGARSVRLAPRRRAYYAWPVRRREATTMQLTPREFDKLIVYMMAEVALKRKAKGIKLNHPEAVAIISAHAMDGARAGLTIEEVTREARKALTRDDVMDGVADMIPMVQVEAVFTDGSRLVTVHSPIQ